MDNNSDSGCSTKDAISGSVNTDVIFSRPEQSYKNGKRSSVTYVRTFKLVAYTQPCRVSLVPRVRIIHPTLPVYTKRESIERSITVHQMYT